VQWLASMELVVVEEGRQMKVVHEKQRASLHATLQLAAALHLPAAACAQPATAALAAQLLSLSESLLLCGMGREPPALYWRSSPWPCANQQRLPRWHPPELLQYMHSCVRNDERTRGGTQAGTASELSSRATASRAAATAAMPRAPPASASASAAGSSASAGAGSKASQVPAWAVQMAAHQSDGVKASRVKVLGWRCADMHSLLRAYLKRNAAIPSAAIPSAACCSQVRVPAALFVHQGLPQV